MQRGDRRQRSIWPRLAFGLALASHFLALAPKHEARAAGAHNVLVGVIPDAALGPRGVNYDPVAMSTCTDFLTEYCAVGLADLSQLRPLTAWQGGEHNAVVNIYASLAAPDSATTILDQITAIWELRSVPMVSLYPTDMADPSKTTEHDTALTVLAPMLQEWIAGADTVVGDSDDRRLYIRLAPEMNGDWSNYQPDFRDPACDCYPDCATLASREATFIDAWRHIHDVLTSDGAIPSTRIAWVFAPNFADGGGTSGAGSMCGSIMENVYPGDTYVDWVGVDGYSRQAATPSDLFHPMFTRLKGMTTKPLAVTEVAACTYNCTPTMTKPDWINSYFSYIQAEGIRMTLWFNVDKEADWAVFWRPDWSGSGDATYYYDGVDSLCSDQDQCAGVAYHAWEEYRIGVEAGNMAGSDPSSQQLLTDDLFLGR